jgi:PKD repeat protein
VLAAIPSLPEPVRAAVTFPCLGAPAGEPAGGVYPEPRIFFESQSWWTQTGEVFPGRHIHTGACIPWLKPVDGVVQFHVRNLLHGMPGTIDKFRLQIWKNGPDPALALPLLRSCSTHDCTFWDSFTIDYSGRLPGRWEHRFTHNIDVNAFGQRQYTTTRWHICVRTCVGGTTTEAYDRAIGAAGWYQGLDYANAYMDPDDYERLRAGVAPGQQRIKIKFDPGSGSVTVDPDAHAGNPGIVQRRASDGLLLGGSLPVTTGTAWFEAILDTTGLAPGMHKLALRGAKANATGREEGVLLLPFIVTGTAPSPPPAAAAFTASPLSGQGQLTVALADTSTGTPTEWTWAFGDGTPDVTVQNPVSHTYTAVGSYTLSLTVDNANGPPSTATKTITVDPPPAPPNAVFTANPLSGPAPLTVSVTNDSTGGTAWSWDFGDGSALLTAQHPSPHVYTDLGPHTLSLTVTNVVGETSTASETITVEPPPAAAAFTASPLSGQGPLTVNLADTSTGGPTEWTWAFGDGTPDVTVQNPVSHTYTAVGSYTLSLTVDNANGPPSTATKTITVDPPPAAAAAFTANPQSGQAPLTVALTDTSTGTPTEWTWAFGDGSPDVTVQNPGSHTYTTVGTYICSLTVDNANGPPSTATKTITVDPPPPPPPPSGRIKDITFDPTLLDPVHGVDKLSGTVTRETAAPLAGAGSARISNASGYVEETFSPTNDVFITFRLKVTGLPSGSPRVLMLSNGGTTQANLLLKSTGRLQLRVGSTIVGAESIALNTTTTYIVGIRQRRGTGGNALVEAYVAPVGTAFGAPFGARANGTWTTAADRLRIGGTNGSAVSVILDNVLIDSSSMPITPLP